MGVMPRNQEPPPDGFSEFFLKYSEVPMREIARHYGVGENRIRRWSKIAGVQRHKTGPRSPQSHGNWKGGRIVDKHGYVLIHMPDHPHANSGGYMREHRVVMEKHLGRILLKSEVVHHKNDQPGDNSISNLEVFENNSSHLSGTLKRKCPKWSDEGKRRIQQASVFLFPADIDLRELYLSQKMTPKQIGKIAGCSGPRVSKELLDQGIPVRNNSEAQQKHHYPSDEVLLEMRMSMTVPEMADILGIPSGSLSSYVVRRKIPSPRHGRQRQVAPYRPKHPELITTPQTSTQHDALE
jgi:hypothetical protein